MNWDALLIVSQSNYLIQVVDTNLHIEWQCKSRSVGFFRSQLIWICTVCKSMPYHGSAGLKSIGKYLSNCSMKTWAIRKHTFRCVHPVKIQISLCIDAFWSESSLGTFWIAKDASFFMCHIKDWSVQTDLTLHWTHRSEGIFSYVAAYMF